VFIKDVYVIVWCRFPYARRLSWDMIIHRVNDSDLGNLLVPISRFETIRITYFCRAAAIKEDELFPPVISNI
jgi:hypothetical protein